MARKPTKFNGDTPLERQLKKQEPKLKSTKQASSKPALFARNPKHKYGTCWQCGSAIAIPGGDYFKCDNCGWLIVK
jgi:DNA-directed RNA polymerase subunit RPC12/RpoP